MNEIEAAQDQYRKISRIGADSPNPWIFKSAQIGGWLLPGDHEYLWHLATRRHEGHILEVGTWMGKSACILAGACIELGNTTQVFCIDTFGMDGTPAQVQYHQALCDERSTINEFIKNSIEHGFRESVILQPLLSTIAFKTLQASNGRFRLAFIDGSHDYDSVKQDCENAIPLLTKGGILAVHDCDDDNWPDIRLYIANELNLNRELTKYGRQGQIAAFEKV